MDLQHPSFFIFGPERSGTTLLTFLLSGQPDVFVLNDSFVFDRYVEWALLGDRNGRLNKAKKLTRLVAGLAPSIRPSLRGKTSSLRQVYYAARGRYALRFHPDDVVSADEACGYYRVLKARYLGSLTRKTASFLNDYAEGIPEPDDDVTIRDLLSWTINSVSSLFLDSPQAVLGEKTPIHTPYAEWIKCLYPFSKRILMVRDPVANVASIYRRFGDFDQAVRIYDMYAEGLMTLGSKGDVLVVTHEDLTSSTRSTLGQILTFLDPSLALDETCPVNAYTKSEYTGTTVDNSRVSMAPNTLSSAQTNSVAARFRPIRERFYG
jgi:hypothetical protein